MTNIKQNLLSLQSYYRPEIFDEESGYFKESWNFVGLLRDLANDNDFRTVQVGLKSVILQNFAGAICAFDNVCAHRGARIRSQSSGNGAVRCLYHCWTYNQDGVPTGLPAASEAFGFTGQDRANLRLKAWAVDTCGEFIFIRESESGSSLKQYLGGYYDELSAISRVMGEEIGLIKLEYNANWKICVENTLDEYHAQFVHRSTFRNVLSDSYEYLYDAPHSKMSVQANDAYLKKWRKIDKLIGQRDLRTENYLHYFIFPMTMVASSFGASFSIQRIIPLSSELSILESRLFLTKSNQAGAIMSTLGDSALQFNQTVFDEDRVVCEQTQLGLKQAEKRPILGNFEQRIYHFQQAVLNCKQASASK